MAFLLVYKSRKAIVLNLTKNPLINFILILLIFCFVFFGCVFFPVICFRITKWEFILVLKSLVHSWIVWNCYRWNIQLCMIGAKKQSTIFGMFLILDFGKSHEIDGYRMGFQPVTSGVQCPVLYQLVEGGGERGSQKPAYLAFCVPWIKSRSLIR